MTQWLAGVLVVMVVMSTVSIIVIGLGEGTAGLRRPFRVAVTEHPEWIKLWLAHVTLAVARFVVPGASIGLMVVRAL